MARDWFYKQSRNKVHGTGCYGIEIGVIQSPDKPRYVWRIVHMNKRNGNLLFARATTSNNSLSGTVREAALLLKSEDEVMFSIPGYEPFVANPDEALWMHWARFLKENAWKKDDK